jgi:hypothetical protein
MEFPGLVVEGVDTAVDIGSEAARLPSPSMLHRGRSCEPRQELERIAQLVEEFDPERIQLSGT